MGMGDEIQRTERIVTAVVDPFQGDVGVLVDEDGKRVGVLRKYLPDGAEVGSYLKVTMLDTLDGETIVKSLIEVMEIEKAATGCVGSFDLPL